MLQKIGYSHIDSSNTEIKFWGNTLGVDFAAPNRVILENGDIVEAAMPYVSFNDGSMVVERWIESNPTTEIDTKIGETIEFREDKTVVVYQYALPEPEILKEHLKSKLATRRWTAETAGITIDDLIYSTDRESQIKYTAIAVAISQADPQTWSVNWKTNDGQFITLNSTQMMYRTNIVMGYVQGCFNREYAIQSEIEACSTVEELLLVDIDSGWPEVTYSIP
jgi:hypothetical protein